MDRLHTSADGATTSDERSEPAAGFVPDGAVMTLLVGLASTFFGVGHLYGVIVSATIRGYHTYNFRFAVLLIVGIMIVAAGTLCIAAVHGLARAQRPAWGRAMSGTLLLLLITVPLIPVQQELASFLSILGAVNLIVLVGARRRLGAG
jgi:hypothetical protein